MRRSATTADKTFWALIHRVIPGLLCVALTPAASASPDVRWVHGSWVNVRSGASAESDVIGQLTTNTEVHPLSSSGDWCEVSAETAKIRGFLACSMLGAHPLVLNTVEYHASPDYSPLRAFWIAPSLHRLQNAGEYYESTMLSERQRRAERRMDYVPLESLEPPARSQIREFEAMKALLQNGYVAPRLRQRPQTITDDELAYLLSKLDPIKTSLFKREDDVASAQSGLEALSAKFGIRVRLRVLGAPKWIAPAVEPTPLVVGHWDMGDVELTLEQPVFEHVIGRDGRVSALNWRGPEKHFAADQDESVWYEAGQPNVAFGTEGIISAHEKGMRPLPGYPDVRDGLVWIYTARPLPYKHASMSVRRIGPPQGAEKGADPTSPVSQEQLGERYSGGLAALSLPLYHIDLNGDGIADLAVCEVRYPSGAVSLPDGKPVLELMERQVFANLAGEWVLVESLQYYG